MKNIYKSIWACFVGILVGVVLSLGTDLILQHKGVIPNGNLWVAPSIILLIIVYRTIYNVLGAYIVGKLAPEKPMKHALIVGVLGTIVSIIGVFVCLKLHLGPLWYTVTLAVLAMPSAWLGGKLAS